MGHGGGGPLSGRTGFRHGDAEVARGCHRSAEHTQRGVHGNLGHHVGVLAD